MYGLVTQTNGDSGTERGKPFGRALRQVMFGETLRLAIGIVAAVIYGARLIPEYKDGKQRRTISKFKSQISDTQQIVSALAR